MKKIINKKAAKDSKPENSNVVRDKTYNRPLERANHRYPTRNVMQQVKVEQSATKSENAEQQLQNIINNKAAKDNKPENSNVVREKNLQ